MKYYRGNKPEDWPVWVEFIVGIFVGTTGVLGCPFSLFLLFGWVSMKAALIMSACCGVTFGCWLIWHRIRGI
jgi:hypothetical protein